MKLVSTPANPVPERPVTGMLKTPGGVRLRFARWAPPPGRKGTVCVFQGRTEFIEKYFEVVRDLHARGFAVASLDWRGQGLSDRALRDPRKGHVRSFSEYDSDLEIFIKEVVLPDCPPPYFALAHSMGAAVLLRAAHRGRRWFDRMVLAAPMIDLANLARPRLARTAARTLRRMGLGASYIPGGGATAMTSMPFTGNPVSSDPVRYARAGGVVEVEPALGLGSPTIAWADAAFRAMAEFAGPGFAGSLRQPMLIIASGRDALVSTPAIEEFAVRLRSGSHLIVAGGRHELLMEQDQYRGQFFAAFDAFVPGSALFG